MSKPVPFIAIEKTQRISFWPTFPVFIVSKISNIFFITQSASYLNYVHILQTDQYLIVNPTLEILFGSPPAFPLYLYFRGETPF